MNRIIVLLLLGMGSAVLSGEKPIAKAEAEKMIRTALEKMKVDWDMTKIYGQAVNDAVFCANILKLLRTSNSTKDPKIERAMSALETNLDSAIISFYPYIKEKKKSSSHLLWIKCLNKARLYRKAYPRKRDLGIFEGLIQDDPDLAKKYSGKSPQDIERLIYGPIEKVFQYVKEEIEKK